MIIAITAIKVICTCAPCIGVHSLVRSKPLCDLYGAVFSEDRSSISDPLRTIMQNDQDDAWPMPHCSPSQFSEAAQTGVVATVLEGTVGSISYPHDKIWVLVDLRCTALL